MQTDTPDHAGALDGSVAGMRRFLYELVEMTAQGAASDATPLLELQFGDVLTVTSLSTAHGAACLEVTAFLPRQQQAGYFPQSSLPAAAGPAAGSDCEFLWHADEGRYVAVRKIALADLPDERSVMDAIMDTSDLAVMWLVAASAENSHPR
ncbi:hypothetical protein [Collimonas humicola]|uniref:hypothetical protein n=1 Tax=Collimonas humicola TaxID=2825886 RepID=UPI001B8C180F|nr:hypothetical protein [Collimonas humicola]